MMKTARKIALGILGISAMGLALLTPQTASAVSLRHHSVVTGHTITLGDIFGGLEGAALKHKADRVIGASPRPGQDMVLNARTLMRIAMALDLPWRPTSAADQVVLRRAATLIDRDLIEERLRESLEDEGVEGNYNLIIPNEMSEVILPADMDKTIEITSMRYNPEYNRFEAELAAPSATNPVQKINVHGTVERLVDIPVLRSTLRAGDIIGQRDIDFISLPERRVKHNIILDPQDVIGLTPRRLVLADKPLKSDDLEAPRIVARGENVTMIFRQGPLLLTAQGKALEFGAKGDAIRVVNLSSSKTVEAIVSAEKEVTVKSF